MNILGLMSGSSLDGLDMALCSFKGDPDGSDFEFSVLKTHQVDFPHKLISDLREAPNYYPKKLLALDAHLGKFFGEECDAFIRENDFEVDFVASHGHTIFHNPEKNFTCQIGNGAMMARAAKRNVICDFRSADIAAGGLGAPCAPIADKYLFPENDILLNLGGISNITIKSGKDLYAFDISPCNQLLNYLAQKADLFYDIDGNLSAKGQVITELLEVLLTANDFDGFGPRAIDNSWVANTFIPLLDKHSSIKDALRTCVEFIKMEFHKAIVGHLPFTPEASIVVTGGGAFNLFLMDQLRQVCNDFEITVTETDHEMIAYKEACLIALMGYLRVINKPNVLKSVTGAKQDTIGGCIYLY